MGRVFSLQLRNAAQHTPQKYVVAIVPIMKKVYKIVSRTPFEYISRSMKFKLNIPKIKIATA